MHGWVVETQPENNRGTHLWSVWSARIGFHDLLRLPGSLEERNAMIMVRAGLGENCHALRGGPGSWEQGWGWASEILASEGRSGPPHPELGLSCYLHEVPSPLPVQPSPMAALYSKWCSQSGHIFSSFSVFLRTGNRWWALLEFFFFFSLFFSF